MPDKTKGRRMKPEWREPLMRILEGHADLVMATEQFPGVGRIPAIDDLRKFEKLVGTGFVGMTPVAAGAAVGVVVVVVCVAVAARPGAITSEELLRAKLLDVYGKRDREHLREAIAFVRANPKAIKIALGVEPAAFGDDFMGRLATVEQALA